MQLRDRTKDLIFVAGGSGMAPIKSLVEELFSEDFEKEAWFFYGARTVKDLYLTEEWMELAVSTLTSTLYQLYPIKILQKNGMEKLVLLQMLLAAN